jgi:Tfp pilus assembly protein PilE
MTTQTWWMLVGVALVIGAAIGSWLGMRSARAGSDSRLRRAIEDLEKKHAAASGQWRANQARAKTELEQAQASFKQQLAAVADEPRAALLRAEERLVAAYAEIDALRRGGAASDTAPSEFGDGFAATKPMRDGM